MESKQYEQALEFFQQALANNNSEEIRVLKKQVEDIIEERHTVEEKKAIEVERAYKEGKKLLKSGNSEAYNKFKIVQDLGKIIAEDYMKAAKAIKLANRDFEAQQYSVALEKYSKIIDNHKNLDFLIDELFANKARKILEQLDLEKAPGNDTNAKLLEIIINFTDKALSINFANSSAIQTKWEAITQLVKEFSNEHEYVLALACLEQAKAIKKPSIIKQEKFEIYKAEAEYFINLKQYEKAYKPIKEALLNSDIKNQNAKTLEELKFIADTLIKNLLEVQEDSKQGEEFLTVLVQSFPEEQSVGYRCALVSCYLVDQKFALAKIHAEQVLKFDKEDTTAQYIVNMFAKKEGSVPNSVEMLGSQDDYLFDIDHNNL
ncbi:MULTISPECIES: hypothetical protein [unclassified Candidatus Tisiphia]|uniref:hypothetical protein n=1 Tax=unclassified Candidatus Tisiphia TaxID=2996318 RepID=UPI003CCB4B87